MDIYSILVAVVGCQLLLNFILFRSQTRRIKNAEAGSAEFNLYKDRLEELHRSIMDANTTIKEQGATITALNKALDDKTDRIRLITDQNQEAQLKCNALNEIIQSLQRKVLRLTEQLDKERFEKVRYCEFHCRISDCDIRDPRNERIRGKKFENFMLPAK